MRINNWNYLILHCVKKQQIGEKSQDEIHVSRLRQYNDKKQSPLLFVQRVISFCKNLNCHQKQLK